MLELNQGGGDSFVGTSVGRPVKLLVPNWHAWSLPRERLGKKIDRIKLSSETRTKAWESSGSGESFSSVVGEVFRRPVLYVRDMEHAELTPNSLIVEMKLNMLYAITQHRAELEEDTNCSAAATRGFFTASQSTADQRLAPDIAAWNASDIDNTHFDGNVANTSINDPGFFAGNASLFTIVVIASLCASLLSLITYLRYKSLRTVTRQLLAATCVADSWTAIFHSVSLAVCSYSQSRSGDGTTAICDWLEVPPQFLTAMNVAQQTSMLLNVAFVIRTYCTVVHGVHPMQFFTRFSVVCSLAVPCLSTLLIVLSTGDSPEQWTQWQLRVSEPLRLASIATVIVYCALLSRHVSKQVCQILCRMFSRFLYKIEGFPRCTA